MTRPVSHTPIEAQFGRSLPPVSAALSGLARLFLGWQNRHRSRCALARLDAHMIRDIGLSPDAVANECVKPFWRD